MPRKPVLKLGDRVHYPGESHDTGTVIELFSKPRYPRPWSTKVSPERGVIIEWDLRQTGSEDKDVDEATRRGRMLTGGSLPDEPVYVVKMGAFG